MSENPSAEDLTRDIVRRLVELKDRLEQYRMGLGKSFWTAEIDR